MWREAEAAAQPVLLTVHDHNPNTANVRFLVEGADMPLDAATYQRLVLLFDGDDDEAVAAARQRWTAAKEAGHDVAYWQQDPQGRWVRRG